MDIIVIIITSSLIIFLVKQKGLERKIDLILILVGVATMFVVDNHFIWISIWLILLLYLGGKYFFKKNVNVFARFSFSLDRNIAFCSRKKHSDCPSIFMVTERNYFSSSSSHF